jgi:hypothetical protein
LHPLPSPWPFVFSFSISLTSNNKEPRQLNSQGEKAREAEKGRGSSPRLTLVGVWWLLVFLPLSKEMRKKQSGVSSVMCSPVGQQPVLLARARRMVVGCAALEACSWSPPHRCTSIRNQLWLPRDEHCLPSPSLRLPHTNEQGRGRCAMEW